MSVAVFILIASAGFVFGPKLIKEDTPPAKEPLNLDYDVNLPIDSEKPAVKETEKPVVITSPYPVPDLDRPVIFYSELPEETKKIAKDRISAITATIKHGNVVISDWVDLGVYRKLTGDYDAALEIWRYASGLSPENYVILNNLANLYSSYLGDYQKAEEYYLKAIEAAPNQSYPYFAAFEFYKSVLKDDKKAEDIVKRGIVAVPDSKADLEALLD